MFLSEVGELKAMEVYSRQQKLGKEVEGHANAIFLEAMRRVGEMLAATGPNGTDERSDCGRPKKISAETELVSKPTLAEIGLSKKRILACAKDRRIAA